MVPGIRRMAGVLWPQVEGRGIREVEREFSKSGKARIVLNPEKEEISLAMMVFLQRSWICECCRDKIC